LHQLNEYLAMDLTEWDDDFRSFWEHNSTVLDNLFVRALWALSDDNIQLCC